MFAQAIKNVRISSGLRFFSTKSASPKLWGGRFSKDTNKAIIGWADSTEIDSKFIIEDIWGSMAHVSMLGKQKIIPAAAACKILGGLKDLHDENLNGDWVLDVSREDVHLNVEGELISRLGIDVAGHMHTTRSRNDQVALDVRMLARTHLIPLREKVTDIVDSFLDKADGNLENIMMGYTHFQHAQPISVGFWLSGYASSYIRDGLRLQNAYDQADMNPLGGGAISGTSFNINRDLTSNLLGFQKTFEHTLDATSSRDYFLDVLHSSATLQNNLSRLAEEFIVWSSYEYRTLTLDDGFAMGSSMMPQKKNPGVLELLRGRSGRSTGYLMAGYTMLKGLPTAYNRDFHEEKEILYRALKLTNRATEIVPALISSTTINVDRMNELANKNFATATEFANYLVANHDIPFRQAHHIVGSIVGDLSRQGKTFEGNEEYCVSQLKSQGISSTLEDILKYTNPKNIVESYNCYGGTGVDSVKKMIKKISEDNDELKKEILEDKKRLNNSYDVCLNICDKVRDLDNYDDFCKVIDNNIKLL